jgi:hypothetical protein
MFTNSGSSVHDLVIMVAFMGALFSGYAGMTIWARKGGKPAGGFLVGGLLGGPGRIHPRRSHPAPGRNRQRRAIRGAHPVSPLRGAHQRPGAGAPALSA